MLRLFGRGSRAVRGPDFASVDSREKAEVLCQRGELQKILLIPAEFGGQDIPPNVVYVPAFAAEMKARIDQNMIKPLVTTGKVTRYQATPEYERRSLVPISIEIKATQPGSFSARVAVWGRGLHEATSSA